ncbi:hypothetical protein GPECTOR_8g3 [Gonium pectorale]|uniref:Glucosamine/galactosamine-6-phosphate isomerase domain-containing protein n=1 Tax=Gonium pectorale TaxID=33097 RepID=A0A150GT74_GONPE|nr:hypothetical protein GPECTOR_8g3 [Gonium pectorale]|eukprot:KXZ52922.1 hypothetical protein GPECTOR_8g3 [Gonium pectorale]
MAPRSAQAGASLLLLAALLALTAAPRCASADRRLQQSVAVNVGVKASSPAPSPAASFKEAKKERLTKAATAIGERVAEHPAAPQLAPILIKAAPKIVSVLEKHPRGEEIQEILLPAAAPIIAKAGTPPPPRPPGHQQVAFFTSTMLVRAGNDAPDDLAVEVHPTEAAVGARICEIVVQAAQAAVAERGYFFLAIPGGSVLKMCGGLTFLFYVNHKCVPLGDKASTHQKALDLFLTRVGAPLANVAALQGSADAAAEAREYESKLRQIAVQRGMELTADVVPRFDLMLLGMGADGHVGSLYPGRHETAVAGPGAPLVLPVDKKQPSSITLSLPVMCAAKQVVVAMTGAGKADAVRAALQSTGGAKTDMPARLVRPVEGGSAVWLMDAPAASKLDVATGARALLAADHAVRAM